MEVAWDLKDKNIYQAQSSLRKIQLSCIMGNVGFTFLETYKGIKIRCDLKHRI